jgi:hypothetical protein
MSAIVAPLQAFKFAHPRMGRAESLDAEIVNPVATIDY